MRSQAKAERDLESAAAPTATEEELIAFVRDRMAHFKAPRGVTFVTDLPKTATGKIQKFVLRGGGANLAKQLSPGGRPPYHPMFRAAGLIAKTAIVSGPPARS